MADDSRTFVIIGAGQAGGRAAEGMRAAGFAGRIVLVGAEEHPPYERPPLSKQVLTGAAEPDSAQLRPRAWYDRNGVALWLGKRVAAIDRSKRELRLHDDTVLPYDGLVIATGSRPVMPSWPGADLAGIQVLRDVADSLAIREQLFAGARVVLVGGGYIGLEVAAAARQMGCPATILEAGDGLMRRQVAPQVGDWYRRLHESHGVNVQTGAQVAGFAGQERVRAVELADGTSVPADLVVVGVGIAPQKALAEAAGLDTDDGIVVDSQGRTTDPAIFACGDVTAQPTPYVDGRVRLESWHNAQNQALVAGRVLAGDSTASHDAVPWFWSDQYDTNLQMLGLPPATASQVMRGDPASGDGFTLVYLAASGAVLGAHAVNRPGDIAPLRRMMEKASRPDPAALADPAVPLKKVLKGQAA